MPTKQSIAEQPSANSKKASRELERAIARLGEQKAGTAGATSNNYRQLDLKMAAGSRMPAAAAINTHIAHDVPYSFFESLGTPAA